MRNWSFREEAGFTLIEVMVTMMVMIVVLFALYSIFDMSMRVFQFGNNKVEAVENARIGLEKMEREIRAAYPYDKSNATPDTHLLDTMSTNEIAFANDRNGNYVIETGETIRYALRDDGTDGDAEYVCETGDTCRVERSVGGGAFEPIVEFVTAPGGLAFTYLLADGVDAGTAMDPTTNTADEPALEAVRIDLTVVVDEGTQNEGTQTLTTEVALRNRGS